MRVGDQLAGQQVQVRPGFDRDAAAEVYGLKSVEGWLVSSCVS